MLRQKQEKSGTGICHVMQGKESKTCPYDSLYSRGDNATLPVNQVRARLNRYKNIFGRADGYIWIKDKVY